MTIYKVIPSIFLLMLAFNVNAGEWQFGFGVTYASGISDVADLYEDNLADGPFVDSVEVYEFPVGVGFRSRYQADSGITVDIGVGPLFVMLGDASHTEIPLSATVGYAFAASANTSPYARLGVSHHFANGDYVESSEPGLLGAVGIEFGRNEGLNWGIELSVDDSTVEFLDFSQVGNSELNSYDTQLSVYFMF